MKAVILTKIERMILLNQFTILQNQNPEDDYSLYKKILQYGYETDYDYITEVIFEPMSKEKGEFVKNVLLMFDDLQYYNKLNKWNKEIKFKGFDQNKEREYFNYTKFLIKDMQDFSINLQEDKLEKENILNSNVPMISTYKYMLNKWKQIKEESEDYLKKLTLDDFKNITECYNENK